MTDETPLSRRRVLRTSGAALAALTVGTGTAAADPGRGSASSNGKDFGRVWADDVLWRTNVVQVLDEEPEPNDDIYFINDGTTASLPPNGGVNGGASPFVSESAPGDTDWNGGQWVHFSAQLADGVTLEEPLTSESEVLQAESNGKLTVSKGRPDVEGAPPDFFVCPLNGRA